MIVLIEEYGYTVKDLEKAKKGLGKIGLESNGVVSLDQVGYYMSAELKDCVFILPKVVLWSRDKDNNPFKDEEGKEIDLVLGKYTPEEFICPDKIKELTGGKKELTKDEQRFVYEFSTWIYRALKVYKKANEKSNIIFEKHTQHVSKVGRRRKSETLLDVLLSIQDFAKENQDFFFFVVKNRHSGMNKINWGRTVTKSTAVVSGDDVFYLDPVNKKRQVNFDEELLVIFFSILNYMKKKYGFSVQINLGYELITGRKFDAYVEKGIGKRRLLKIKYKYFSDKALKLWDLCYAFFESEHKIFLSGDHEEYLLAKKFDRVFEAMIDELIGDKEDKDIPPSLKKQDDGKLVDHMYHYQELMENRDLKHEIFYIGDSKYYKYRTPMSKEAVYKQFTYAKNVIQWHLNLFLSEEDDKERKQYRNYVEGFRDDVTEGYDVTPNFFISAMMSEDLRGGFKDDEVKAKTKKDGEKRVPVVYFSRQFENRLFDRDTLIVAHYDVNFLFLIALYARDNAYQKASWKENVRRQFREEIQKLLAGLFDFYAMTPRADVDAEHFLRENFQLSLGKVYTPYGNQGTQSYYSLALGKDEKFKDENDAVMGRLEQGFKIAKCPLGTDPSTVVSGESPVTTTPVPQRFLTHHWIENYLEKYFLVGCYKDAAHRGWILGRNKFKRTDLYNVRLGSRAGAVVADAALTRSPKFLILYDLTSPTSYSVYRIKNGMRCEKAKMLKMGYSSAHCDYFCYVLDEEVTLGDLDIPSLIAERKGEQGADFKSGAPIYLKGGELIGFRR